MKLTALFVSAFVATTLGIPLEHVQHEKRSDLGLAKRGSAEPSTEIPVRIALKQRNLDKGMDLLMEVSDPSSAKYGQHYTQEQVVDMFSPESSSIEAVKRWLVDAGIPEDSITTPRSKGWVDFKTTVGNLEGLLKTSYHIYDGKRSDGQFLGTDGYSLPSHIAEVVDYLQPAVAMTKVKARGDVDVRRKPIFNPLSESDIERLAQTNGKAAVTGCDTRVTPECIKALYKIPGAPKNPNPKNRFGMFEVDNEYHKQSDLDLFYNKVYPAIPKGTGPKIDLINWGSKKPNAAGAVGEAALDFDMAYPIIYPQQIELFQSKTPGKIGFEDQFLDAIDGSYCTKDGGDDPNLDGVTPNQMCGKFEPVPVYSFSYGWQENEYTVKYLNRQCNEFMKLGLQGSTMVWASGDGGVAGGHGGDCQGNGDIFTSISPAACPYVTTVGATMVASGGSVTDPEVVTDQFSPGGGFSNMWTTPDYQKSAVDSFFKNSDPGFPSYNTSNLQKPSGNGIYNRAGRGFPDIAANGLGGVVAFNGQIGTSGGTSQAAPIMAAIFNRINEERLAAGKSLIGFVNPAIYKNPQMFNDITEGGMSKGSDGGCNGKSWDAAPGWDPVTGLGTPNYPAMSKYFASL